MNCIVFVFSEGSLNRIEKHIAINGNELYVKYIPRNIIEFCDIFKKLSHLTYGIYVVLYEEKMKIYLYPKNELEPFKKIGLTREIQYIEMNSRLKDFLMEWAL